MASVREGENEGRVSQTSSMNCAATNSMTTPASPQNNTPDPPPEHFHGTQGGGYKPHESPGMASPPPFR
jgi:hypothetical protein